MAYPEPRQEPFTMVPNVYLDRIMPRLTDTQRVVCDIVIRETIGWHKESAVISNTAFKAKTGKSEPAIIRAKKSLEEMGVLIVLQEGGGSQTGEYALDLYYDNPDRSIRASLLQQNELVETDIPEPQDNTLELLEAPAVYEDLQPELDDMDCEVTLDSETDEEPILESNVDDCQAEMSDMVDTENLSDAEDSDTPYEDLAPLIVNSINNILSKERKQTEESEDEKAERKEATATVCSLLRSWGAELEQKDYSFVGWIHKTYGIEAVQQKMEIMKLQRSRGVKFSNPLGWLRSALSGNYGFCRWDTEVLKGKERAEKASERLRLEQIEREREIREAEELKNEAEGMKLQLAPEDKEDLRKAAIEKISGMGIASNWINEPLIESVENEILRYGSPR